MAAASRGGTGTPRASPARRWAGGDTAGRRILKGTFPAPQLPSAWSHDAGEELRGWENSSVSSRQGKGEFSSPAFFSGDPDYLTVLLSIGG